MTLSLYDPVTPSGAQAVMEWARLAHESVTGRDGYSDFYKKDLQLDILGPVGDVVSQWVIKGAYCKTATFGEYDWSAEAAIQFRYHHCNGLLYLKLLKIPQPSIPLKNGVPFGTPFSILYIYIHKLVILLYGRTSYRKQI
jgi:hypothetical protein